MRKGTAITWLAVSVWWLLTGLVWTGQVVTMFAADGQKVDFLQALPGELVSALLWIPITMVLFWWVRRLPIERTQAWSRLATHALAVAGVIVFRAGMVVLLNDFAGWYAVLPTWSELMGASALNNLLMAWMVIGVAHALVYAERERERRRQAAEIEIRLSRARLEALAAQLDPHFLFNALNSIAELVHRDANAADRMLVGLGEILRGSLDSAHSQEVPLQDELDLISHYIRIEQLRLGPRLGFECTVAPEALPARVPRLVLQPLVENAIRHAIAPKQAPGRVAVRAHCRGDRLVLEVQDDGDDKPTRPGNGIGLRNTRERLRWMYGEDHDFDMARQPGGGMLARLAVPLRFSPQSPVAAA